MAYRTVRLLNPEAMAVHDPAKAIHEYWEAGFSACYALVALNFLMRFRQS